MAWTETQPRHWQRPMGENEAMIKMIGDGGRKFNKDTWSISVTARFSAHLDSKPLIQALCDGWKTFRFNHPSIATTNSDDNILLYQTPSSIDLDHWVDDSFVLIENDIPPTDIVARLTPRRYPTLYYLASHSTIVLTLSHWHTDGIGAFLLLNAYFASVLSSLKYPPFSLPWGTEPSRLVPSIESALSLPATPTPDIDRATKHYLSTLAHNAGNLPTPYDSSSSISPKGTQATHLRLPKHTTTRLLSACHRLSIRLEAAVHASVTAAAYAIAPASSTHKHHSSTMRQSLRPHLPPPYDGEAGAAGLYTAGYIVKVPASHSWLENAKFYESEYARGATGDLLCSRREYASRMKDILEKITLTPPEVPPSGLDVSYVPNAEACVQSVHVDPATGGGVIEVLEIGIGVEVVSRHMYVFVWVFDGRLELRLVYNEGFYEGGLGGRVLGIVEKELVENLRDG